MSKATDKIGRKKSLIAIAIPQILSWVLIMFARKSVLILISRFLSGLSGGALYVIIPLFTSEISDDRYNEFSADMLIEWKSKLCYFQNSRKTRISLRIFRRNRNPFCLHEWNILQLRSAAFHLRTHIDFVFDWHAVLSRFSSLFS